jgi:tRNA A37 threonylcarbamoyladenosine synthetase subunit TsaC/SUA5/YrdC
LPKTQAVLKEVSDGETVGVRIPDTAFCIELARALGRPYTATSANRSGEESKRNVSDILTQLGEAAEAIDLVIDAGELPERLPSTVVDASGPVLQVLRQGAIDIEV